MKYTNKLLISMAIPTLMVAGAGLAVMAGAGWLAGQATQVDAATVTAHLELGGRLVAALTALCVGCCVGFTIWILRSAHAELGGDPAEARAALAALADGRLDLRLAAAPAGSLMDSLQRLSQSLEQTVRTIQASVEQVRRSAGEIADGNQDLSERTEQAAANLQRSASSMEQLTATVRHTADSAQAMRELAASAVQAAQRGGAAMSDVVAGMHGIQASSQRITEIIGTIDAIAFQTNILALNAAVEAARAGEQGRGFAVVAGEVRTLAQRSAGAAREIKELIGQSVERVRSGSLLVDDAGGSMQHIVGSVDRVSQTIAAISRSAAEQSSGLGVVNDAVVGLERMTQCNAGLVEQGAAAAASLHEQTLQLSHAVSRFRVAGAPA